MLLVYFILAVSSLGVSNGLLPSIQPKYSQTSWNSWKVSLNRNSNSNDRFPMKTSNRVKKIKELTTQKDVLNDVTAAEFALTVENTQQVAIDYEMLLRRLDNSLRALTSTPTADVDLIDRVKRTKSQLQDAFTSYKLDQPSNAATVTSKTTKLKGEMISDFREITEDIQEITGDIQEKLRIFVREDGTIDWDGAIQSGKEVAKFGTDLFERLNGKDEAEGLPSLSELLSPAQERAPESEETMRLAGIVSEAKESLSRAQSELVSLRTRLRDTRREGIAVTSGDLQELRLLEARVKDEEQKVQLYSLDLDMERICLFLQQELENAVDPPTDQRLFVAEVNLIDKQLSNLFSNLRSNNDVDSLVSLIDSDELTLISNQVTYLKSRLGIDSSATREMDWGTVGKVFKDSLAKISEGLSFYGEGTKLLISDVQYAWSLTAKAALEGYKLKPREVNAARRTGRDLLTMIPFTIILIIPLTPVGHVLVFNFIQRFFPDFFPSCYTEKRLNLLRLYSEIEKKSEDELIGTHLLDDDRTFLAKAVDQIQSKPLVILAIFLFIAFVII